MFFFFLSSTKSSANKAVHQNQPPTGPSKILILTENYISVPKAGTIVRLIISLFISISELYTRISPCRRLPGKARLQSDGTCAEDNIHIWVKRTSPYPLIAGMRVWGIDSSVRCWQLVSALEWVMMDLLTLLSCFPFTSPPSCRFVLSRSNRAMALSIQDMRVIVAISTTCHRINSSCSCLGSTPLNFLPADRLT